jgi:methyltransferase (TIGR00027 family)
VLDDPFALMLVGPEWREILTVPASLLSEPVSREGRAWLVGRARYAEDRLLDGRFDQYVILGAGLDSFAWRRPDLLRSLRVFEVDHPATQAWKQERMSVLALPAHDRHIFAPVDFENETLRDGLNAAGLDWSQPTIFSWLGVTAYLTIGAIEATLRTVASCAAGSEIVLTYCPTDEFIDDLGREFRRTMGPVAAKAGEPYRTLLTPPEASALVEGCGLKVVNHPTRDDLHARYFADRTDGLTPATHERLIVASVLRDSNQVWA